MRATHSDFGSCTRVPLNRLPAAQSSQAMAGCQGRPSMWTRARPGKWTSVTRAVTSDSAASLVERSFKRRMNRAESVGGTMTVAVGQRATRSLTLTPHHVQTFAELTGDYNP